jgi:hypothetical protein
MMLNIEKIQTIAQSYTEQELFAALVLQRRFNEFNGEEIITDLAQNLHLWKSFLFSKPIYAPDKDGLSFNGLLETLLAMANYRPMPEHSILHFISYPADTLYILTENQDEIVSQLIDLGKKWQADDVSICDGNSLNEEEEWEFRDYISLRLKRGLRGEDFKSDRDAAIVSYWWD